MIPEELALVKQNGAWKPRRKKGWSGLFYPPNGLNFQFCWFNLIFLIAPSWSESNFILFYFILFYFFIRSELVRSESIRVDPTRTGGPGWSGPTFVPAYFSGKLEMLFECFVFETTAPVLMDNTRTPLQGKKIRIFFHLNSEQDFQDVVFRVSRKRRPRKRRPTT